MASFSRGLASARPAASSVAGTFYWATDTEELSFSTGSAWIVPSDGPLTTQIATGPKGDPGDPADGSLLPTQGQKNALSGSQGTPGVTNPYVTTQDPRLSDARPPAAHTHPEMASHVKLTADLPASTAIALANTTGLSFAVTSGSLYRFTAFVVFRSAAITTGIRLGATCPAFTVYTAAVSVPLAADGAAGMWHGWLTSSGDSVVATGVQAANTDYLAVVHGVLLPSASGTFQLQHATEVAASAVTVRNGSHISYQAV